MFNFDICICTRNRPEALETCLRSVFASGLLPAKVIVSDDSSDGHTKSLLDREFPQVVYVTGPKEGLGANRNRALDEVSGVLVSFLDDDAVLAPDFFQCAFAFAAEHGLDLTRTILTGVEVNQGAVIRSNDQDFLGFQKRKYAKYDEIKTIVINSAIIPGHLAKEIGFDGALVYGYDEVDFAVRARAVGCKIAFCPTMSNRHFPSSVNRDYYCPHTDASRIYVMFKRYFCFERNYFKAALFIVFASAHQVAANVKRSGPKGVVAGLRSLRMAYQLIFRYLVNPHHAAEYIDSQLSPRL